MKSAAAIGVFFGLGVAQPVLAQTQPYETKLYKAQPPAETDKNYGLPSFGMPGSELPKQKTMAPDPAPSGTPDFFAGVSDIPLPKTRIPRNGADTPGFSTDRDPATEETPAFTTGQGYSTETTQDPADQ